VINIAIDFLGREGALIKLLQAINFKFNGAAVCPTDVNNSSGLNISQVPEDRYTFVIINVANDYRWSLFA
jgi:hypothetical protein